MQNKYKVISAGEVLGVKGSEKTSFRRQFFN